MKLKALGLALMVSTSVVTGLAFGTGSAGAQPICSPTPDGFLPFLQGQCSVPGPAYPHTNYPNDVQYNDLGSCQAVAASYRQTPGVTAFCDSNNAGNSGPYTLSVYQH